MSDYEAHCGHPDHPDCEHRTLIDVPDSPLWGCTECEREMPIEAWHQLKDQRT